MIIGIIVILSLPIILIGFFLIKKFYLHIDSDQGCVDFGFGKQLSCAFLLIGDVPICRFQILFFRKELDMIKWAAQSSKKDERKKKHKDKKGADRKKNQLNIRQAARMVKRMFRTFHVKQFKFHLDTDNFVLNAYLFPIAYFVGRKIPDTSINFVGRNELVLRAENRLYKLLFLYLKYRKSLLSNPIN